ncbi:hypothetical protein [Priestia megaterium]|uniref:Uncharacterized protein n=1 Tax=Priestia megaterium TaxID=1404 RepID=A0A6M6DZ18_PRIMG|nr:hypothetical protein [Priestia megaterium]QJX80153.1 hypothetical protein FDZ14_29085 [Priestia megaterium]
MNVKYFLIDKGKEEIAGPDIESNTKIKKTFSIEEIETLIEEPNVLLFVNKHDNLLEPIFKEELLEKWGKEFVSNINTNDCGSVDDYENGYFYYIDVWEMGEKAKIVVFSLQH